MVLILLTMLRRHDTNWDRRGQVLCYGPHAGLSPSGGESGREIGIGQLPCFPRGIMGEGIIGWPSEHPGMASIQGTGATGGQSLGESLEEKGVLRAVPSLRHYSFHFCMCRLIFWQKREGIYRKALRVYRVIRLGTNANLSRAVVLLPPLAWDWSPRRNLRRGGIYYA